ncbi:MAG: hypothetical protein KME31_15510 [Tolypothrix carrinoi HA7290-LM1]|nr:hypothetical protein [Tolypothrix carrinoi HA7290-LM1]
MSDWRTPKGVMGNGKWVMGKAGGTPPLHVEKFILLPIPPSPLPTPHLPIPPSPPPLFRQAPEKA